MRRIQMPPREAWQGKVESQGLTFHSRTAPYWNEEAAYAFSEKQIEVLENTANNLQEMCLDAAQHIIDKGRFKDLGISDEAAQLITDSWNGDELHLYGRFDLAYDGYKPPKLLEYNADTPTSLLEAAVIQWYWLQDVHPNKDQLNSLHEKLIARWQQLGLQGRVDFATLEGIEEDVMTTEYLRDTAHQAGLDTQYLNIGDIGYDAAQKTFVDLSNRKISTLFKLYPWEWMTHEEFGKHLGTSGTRFIEPAWKMLWSNKGILPILWQLNKGHPNLLPAYDNPGRFDAWVKKPLLSREGANVTISNHGEITETEGEYGAEGFIYQQYERIQTYDGKTPVLGIWMIGDECCGMGIRESEGPITGNLSRFTPHYIE